MTKVNHPRRRRRQSASPSQQRWLLVTFVAFAGCTLLAVSTGAQQSDSGWAIGTPTVTFGREAQGQHQQPILRHVFEQSQHPLLSNPSPTAVDRSSKEDVAPVEPKTASTKRVEAGDGWRAVGQSAVPVMGGAAHVIPQIAALQLAAPKNTKNAAEKADADCSGQQAATTPTTQPQSHDAPALADAYGSEPSAAQTGAEPDEDCQGTVTGQTEEGNAATAAGDDLSGNDESNNGAKAPSAPARSSNSKPVAKTVVPVQEKITPPPPLTKQLIALRGRVRSVLSGYYKRSLNSRDNDPWEVMHGMLAYGVQSKIHQGNPRGDLITSVGWLCYNKPCKGQTLMYVNPQGEVRAKYGVGLQGHLGQLLAMLAQCHVSADYPIHVGNKVFTVHDLIESEKKTCYPKSELTFKLIALQHYIDLDDKWVNDQGVDWDMPRLIREELAQPIRGAACGGTHRLSGLSLAVKTRVRRGEPLDGEYGRAAEFIKKYQQYAFRLQNRDGSLSTSWFRGAGDEDDINRRIKTTGHILEWLCYSLSDEELRDQRTVRAVTYLANLMYSNYDNEWEVGPVSHATHALLLYDERVFIPHDKEGAVASYRPSRQIASGPSQNSKR
jgi:hypothetical protein